jgi:predicted nucleic acid-binding Zn ribbon protein
MSEWREREPQTIKDLLDRMMSSAGFAPRMEFARLHSAWAEAVGETIAAHSEPISLEQGVLTVRADSAVWASELKLLGGQIATAVTSFLGGRAVTEVRVRVGDGSGDRPRRGRP